jgi:Zn-dependent peptidase ImmA (M78 family)
MIKKKSWTKFKEFAIKLIPEKYYNLKDNLMQEFSMQKYLRLQIINRYKNYASNSLKNFRLITIKNAMKLMKS